MPCERIACSTFLPDGRQMEYVRHVHSKDDRLYLGLFLELWSFKCVLKSDILELEHIFLHHETRSGLGAPVIDLLEELDISRLLPAVFVDSLVDIAYGYHVPHYLHFAEQRRIVLVSAEIESESKVKDKNCCRQRVCVCNNSFCLVESR